MYVCVYSVCVGSGFATGGSPVQGVLTSLKTKTLKWNKAFHGYRLLHSVRNRKRDTERDCCERVLWATKRYVTCRMVHATKWRVLVRMIVFISNQVTHSLLIALTYEPSSAIGHLHTSEFTATHTLVLSTIYSSSVVSSRILGRGIITLPLPAG
jgi:hypothetical protein